MPYIAFALPVAPFDVEKRLVKILEAEQSGTASLDTLVEKIEAWCREQDINLLPAPEMVESCLRESERFTELAPGLFRLA